MAKQSKAAVAKSKPAKPTKKQSDDFASDDVLASGESAYFKTDLGENKVRIISKPIIGWVAWEEDEDGNRRPIRTQIDDEPNKNDYDKKDAPKKFMALAIVDYNDMKVKIWEVTQQSIIKAIKALAANEDWGNPFGYDLRITRTGEGLKTKYVVTPSPKKPLAKELVKAAMEKRCYLEALYEGNDPWEVEEVDELTEYQFK